MFPIIPQRSVNTLMGNYHKDTHKQFNIDTMVKSEIKPKTQCKILSGNHLPKNSITLPFTIADVLKVNSQSSVSVRYKNGCLQTNCGNWGWIKEIKLANDIYSNNCLIEMNIDKKIQLKIVKDIKYNEELVLWFSEEVTRFMGILHLSPINIQGQNKYYCQNCHHTYENPNPLKIHLSIGCDNFQNNLVEILWNRLSVELTRWSSILPLSTSIITIPTYSSTLSTATTSTSHFTKRYPSAFHPIKRHENERNKLSTFFNVNVIDPNEAASNLETIVSNMGTSKQGHLCIYCGKLYSRKYGLKIHIRTHTGFKPLKCKYCLRPFGDPSNLNKHIRLHSQNNVNYKCRLCDKLLVRRRDLERHIQTKHGINSDKMAIS